MPGPEPKPAAMRQRRNKAASRATLPAERKPRKRGQTPRLPQCPNEPRTWHAMARRWWRAVWQSPMSSEFLGGDEPALFRLVVLVDKFWKTGELEYAREIRLLEREFGLTPLSRRRLEWNVVQAEESKSRYEERRIKRATVVEGDPRAILGAS